MKLIAVSIRRTTMFFEDLIYKEIFVELLIRFLLL